MKTGVSVPLLAIACLAVAGCVEVREGHFACRADSDCPSGWWCRDDQRCYSVRAASDAGIGRSDAGDAGRGADAARDRDGDGAPDSIDCDPDDREVGTTATRECTNACGSGAERCEQGEWAACDAPTDCICPAGSECVTGDVQTESESCGGACGSRSRTRTCTDACAWGAWTEFGACEGATGCAPNTVETMARACSGGCGTTGTQEATRTCSALCEWGAWSEFGPCHDCAPATEQSSTGCARCGTQSGARSCNTATCTWGEWTYGPCENQGVCDPGDFLCADCGGFCAEGGRRSARRTCTTSCTWVTGVCGSCTSCGGLEP